MKTILKWPGGKEKELSIIRENAPKYKGRFIEPFVGGGAVFFDITNEHCCINDKSHELINLYNCVKIRENDFVRYLQKEYNEFRTIDKIIDKHPEDALKVYHSGMSVDEFIAKYNDIFGSMGEGYNDILTKEVNAPPPTLR